MVKPGAYSQVRFSVNSSRADGVRVVSELGSSLQFNNKRWAMFRFKVSISLSILLLLSAANVSVAGSDHPDAATVRAALEQGGSSGAQSQAAAVKTTPFAALTMRGSGTATFTDGACP